MQPGWFAEEKKKVKKKKKQVKRKPKERKPNFKFSIPKKEQRFKFPKDYVESEDIKHLIANKKEFGWESYLRVNPHDAKEGDPQILVYTVFFTRLLGQNFLKLIELKTGKEDLFYTQPFWKEYQKAYMKGRDYFEEKFAASSDALYSNNGHLLERTLHTHYYHTDFDNFGEGWNYWEKYSPHHFDFETLKRYGYYAGIISSLNEYRRLHPIIFQNFSRCKISNDHVEAADSEVEDLKRNNSKNVFNLKMKLEIPVEHFKVLYLKKNENGLTALSKADFILFIKRAFLGVPNESPIILNMAATTKERVVGLFHRFYSLGIVFEENSKKRDKYIRLLTDYFKGFDYKNILNNFRDNNKSL